MAAYEDQGSGIDGETKPHNPSKRAELVPFLFAITVPPLLLPSTAGPIANKGHLGGHGASWDTKQPRWWTRSCLAFEERFREARHS